ncbi:MAG: chloride channel protein [Deltaproteobacteria bacterium]|nr:chloride channel protein [Deltaproteobacteria bacterium]MBW2020245.1 chloride channel protein [Deltaproteobacteria bacterium]MBW2075016.1 chloride channel protein [Deltaproteobacteria bacterium]RLB83408.1 MAG: chloride channel protein [Deltaproteobacteria bacterium]
MKFSHLRLFFLRTIWHMDERLFLIAIAIFVGACGGLAAVALNRLLFTLHEILRPLHIHWYAFVLPACGAALSSLFLGHIVKEGAGHGVPEVIYSVSKRGGLLRLRSSFSRLISSTLTIASGGSAGPEAPVVMSGASIGSNVAKIFALNDRQRVTIVGCGAASAISSIFNAPIAGIVFSVEVILGEWTTINLIPIAIASVIGTEVSRLMQGNQIPFSHHRFNATLLDILASVGIALLAGLSSVLFARLLNGTIKKSRDLVAHDWIRAALGGACVGLLGLSFPSVLGEGYDVVRTIIENEYQSGLLLVALATVAKIVATSLTIGTGGSGGIFAPCLVIGSLGGLAYQRGLAFFWPSVPWAEEGFFAMLGMAGVMSGTLQAPLTGIFLIVEVTGSYEVILPLILVSAVSATLCHYMEPVSFYYRELVSQGQLLRPRTDARLLADLNISELIEKDYIVVRENMRLRDMIPVIEQASRDYFPVEDSKTGDFLGLIRLKDVRPYLFNPGLYDAVILGEIMDTNVPHVSPFDDMKEVLELMDQTHSQSLPVVHRNKFLGMVSKVTILDRYRKELIVQTY